MSINRPYTSPLIPPTYLEVFSVTDGIKKAKRIVYGNAVTNDSGIATFYITDNGLLNGNVLLTSIDCVNPSVYSTDENIINRPRVQMREKNVASKYVSANVTNISGVVVLSVNVLGSENAMAGQIVEFMVIGSYDV